VIVKTVLAVTNKVNVFFIYIVVEEDRCFEQSVTHPSTVVGSNEQTALRKKTRSTGAELAGGHRIRSNSGRSSAKSLLRHTVSKSSPPNVAEFIVST